VKNIGAGYLNRLEMGVFYIFGIEHFDLAK